MANLTDKQRRFIDEYMVDLNATQAAIRAGYSEKTAGQQGFENLKKPEIQNEISKRQKVLSEKLKLKSEDVLREYANIAFANIGMVAEWDGETVTLKKSSDLSERAIQAICEVANTDSGVKVKMHSKVAALDALAKHLGLFKPDGGNIMAVFDFNLTGEPDDED